MGGDSHLLCHFFYQIKNLISLVPWMHDSATVWQTLLNLVLNNHLPYPLSILVMLQKDIKTNIILVVVLRKSCFHLAAFLAPILASPFPQSRCCMANNQCVQFVALCWEVRFNLSPFFSPAASLYPYYTTHVEQYSHCLVLFPFPAWCTAELCCSFKLIEEELLLKWYLGTAIKKQIL